MRARPAISPCALVTIQRSFRRSKCDTGERAKTPGPDLELIGLIAARCEAPIVAEGRIHTPEWAASARRAGAFAVCVGTAITHPSTITSWFADALAEVAAQ